MKLGEMMWFIIPSIIIMISTVAIIEFVINVKYGFFSFVLALLFVGISCFFLFVFKYFFTI